MKARHENYSGVRSENWLGKARDGVGGAEDNKPGCLCEWWCHKRNQKIGAEKHIRRGNCGIQLGTLY